MLTGAEVADLCAVGDLLAIDTSVIGAALEPPMESASSIIVGHFEIQPGDLIVLTGEMSRPRSDWDRDLAFHGFTTWDAVTKNVRLLAAADPDSLSGKARKARDYGIPVVSESWRLERWPSCHWGLFTLLLGREPRFCVLSHEDPQIRKSARAVRGVCDVVLRDTEVSVSRCSARRSAHV